MFRAIAASVGACLLFVAWLFRYDITPAATQSAAVVYRLDRWTGEVSLIGPFGIRPLKLEAP